MISVHSLIWEPVALALLYASTHSQLGKGSTQLLKPTEMPTILKSIGTLENKERGLQKGPLTFKKKKKVRKKMRSDYSEKLINAEYLYKLRKSLLPPTPMEKSVNEYPPQEQKSLLKLEQQGLVWRCGCTTSWT